MNEESWRPVHGWEAFYEVSDHGRVRALVGSMKVLKPNRDTQGYLQVKLYYRDTPKTVVVHGLVLEAFDRPRPAGLQCRHLDGNKRNNRLDNLRWGTAQENAADTIALGRMVNHRGEDHWMAVLTENQVVEIRKIYASGVGSQRKLARSFGVHRSTIAGIIKRQIWRHVA